MRIRLLRGGQVARSYRVRLDTFTIGSGADATIRAPNVEGLAPRHALVWLDDRTPTLFPWPGCRVEVNGQQVRFAQLGPEDVVSIGRLELQVWPADEPEVDDEPLARCEPARVEPACSGSDEDEPTAVDRRLPESLAANAPPAPAERVLAVPLPSPSLVPTALPESLRQPRPPADAGEEDEWDFVEPFSLVAEIEKAGPPGRAGSRESYVVAEVTRSSAGRLHCVETVMPGESYGIDPSMPPIVRVGKDGLCTVALPPSATGWAWTDGRETPLAALVRPGAGLAAAKEATLSDGDRAVLELDGVKLIVDVLRPPRAAVPRLSAALLPLGLLLPYVVGAAALVFGGLVLWLMAFPPDLGGEVASPGDDRSELLGQGDLVLLAPLPVDQTEVQPVPEDGEAPDESVREDAPRRTMRATRVARTVGGRTQGAAAQLISALSSGGGGESLQDAITTIDAVGPAGAVTAPFRTSGLIARLPGGEVKLGSRGPSDGIRTLGSADLRAQRPGLGALEPSSAAAGDRIRGRVTPVSGPRRIPPSLDRGQVVAVINRHIAAITHCYETRLLANPALSGQIVFDWIVTESGGVSAVSVRSSTVSDPLVASCIRRVIQRMRFPQPRGGPAAISFPFGFRAVD
jgi:hypothetical protein